MARLNNDEVEMLRQKARTIRQLILETYVGSGGGHFGGSLSAVEILTVLYGKIMRYDPKLPRWPDRDRLVLSKGHTNGALCSALAEFGFFPKELLKTFNEVDSPFGMHPDMHKIPGCDMSTGSLGHGSPCAAGMAIAGKFEHNNYFVYLILGDGECQEGTVWESASVSSQYKLSNLIAILDRNHLSQEGNTENVNSLEPLASRWKSFGWNVYDVDGHDVQALYEVITFAKQSQDRPSVIIANTIKGRGISFMENNFDYHHATLSAAQIEIARSELY